MLDGAAAGAERDVAAGQPQLLAARRIADSCMIGSTAAGGTTLSRSAIALSTLPRTSARSTLRSPIRIEPVISTFLRTSSSTSSRNIAPGNGTWSRDHCDIAWKPSTNSSFQRLASSVAFCATSVVGACM